MPNRQHLLQDFGPVTPDKVVPAEMGELDLKSIKVLIGKLDRIDQCFLSLKSNIVYKGHVLAKQDIALLLTKE